jgi:hypothetical protein
MAQNPTRLKARKGKVYDAEGKEVDLVSPGFNQSSAYDPDSDEAQAKASGDKPVEDMSHAELDAYAAEHGIDLSGAAKRDEKIAAINASML